MTSNSGQLGRPPRRKTSKTKRDERARKQRESTAAELEVQPIRYGGIEPVYPNLWPCHQQANQVIGSCVIYVHRLNGPGEDPIDFYKCTRFVLTTTSERTRAERSHKILYLTPDGRWFEHWEGWCEVFRSSPEGFGFNWCGEIREIEPVSAAWDLYLIGRRAELPPELLDLIPREYVNEDGTLNIPQWYVDSTTYKYQLTLNSGAADQSSDPGGSLTPCKRDILLTLAEAPGRLSTSKLMEAMGRAGREHGPSTIKREHGPSTIKKALPELRREGLVDNDREVTPVGYGLTETGRAIAERIARPQA
jgi:hypothetical protein